MWLDKYHRNLANKFEINFDYFDFIEWFQFDIFSLAFTKFPDRKTSEFTELPKFIN